MNILSVRIRNYRSILSYDWDLTAQSPGIIQVCGTVGAGKSNLYRSVFWALTGKEPRKRFKVSSLRPRHARTEDSTEVVVEFSHRGAVYQTTRAAKGRGCILTTFCAGKPVGPVDLDAHQRWLEDSFGASESALSQTLLFAKGRFENIGYLPPAEMVKYFESAVGFRFEDANTTARSMLKSLNEKLARREAEYASAYTRLQDIEDHVRTLAQSKDSYVQDQKVDRDLLLDAKRKAARFFWASETDISKTTTRINELRAGIQELSSVICANEGKCPTCGQSTPCDHKARKLSEQKRAKFQAELDDLVEKHQQHQDALRQYNEALSVARQAENRITMRESRRQQLSGQAEMLSERLSTALATANLARHWCGRLKARIAPLNASIALLPPVRRALTEAARDMLNELLPVHLETLSGGHLTGRVADDYTVDVQTSAGVGHDDLSDGEMTMVDLAWMLAYREMMIARTGAGDPSRVLFIDERLSHLHVTVLWDVLEALSVWAKSTGTTVYLVHHGEVPDYLVDAKLLVSKNDDGTTTFTEE